ncbi:AAA family ATPase [Ensifer aridi]|uniref:bifunctional aminoglycoside phosphotransferase/ATP-binding protein n=1 Tax=Ensifer aridi TaxID=1708715 RepID=UPI0009C1A61E|nr:bifunctional aminoglycoside phosphotransferase/ATP-binding protein [Ensifer aridi]
MVAEDQSNVISFLQELGGTNGIKKIETHISYVFLIGNGAFKVKRAVKLPYVDFSTPELRLKACWKELVLNVVTAPGLYLGVRKIMRGQDGRLQFDEGDELVDAVVEMVRLDPEALFDRMAVTGRLTAELMTRTARMIARFHRGARPIHQSSGSANIAGVLQTNAAGFATSGVFAADELETFEREFEEKLSVHAALLDAREAAGKVMRCHGDLHLRNICVMNGEPRLFDCIEFNDQIATVDKLYDVAFLLMDLWHRGFPEFANLVANRYLDEVDDEDGFVLLPYFMAIRAAVRAHVVATQIADSSAELTGKLATEARSYFDLARSLIVMQPPRLIAIGGLSGAGKTTIAEVLAPQFGAPPGARIVESDRIRKAMHGVEAEERLGPAAYRPEVSDKVYGEMARRTLTIVRAGGSAVAAAVFDRAPNRSRIEAVAREAGVPCTAVWLDAKTSSLRRRVTSRTASPSDADVEVLARQLVAGTSGVTWERVDAERDANDIARMILDLQYV